MTIFVCNLVAFFQPPAIVSYNANDFGNNANKFGKIPSKNFRLLEIVLSQFYFLIVIDEILLKETKKITTPF